MDEKENRIPEAELSDAQLDEVAGGDMLPKQCPQCSKWKYASTFIGNICGQCYAEKAKKKNEYSYAPHDYGPPTFGSPYPGNS